MPRSITGTKTRASVRSAARLAKLAGYDYHDMLRLIIEAAIKRYGGWPGSNHFRLFSCEARAAENFPGFFLGRNRP